LKLLLSAALAALFFLVFFRLVPPEEILELFSSVSASTLALAFLLYSVSQILRSLRWSLLLGLPLRWSLLLNAANVFLNVLLPARSGELSWFYYAKRLGLSFKASLWSFLVGRLYDLAALLAVVVVFKALEKGPLLAAGALLSAAAVTAVVPLTFRMTPEKGRLKELKGFLLRELTPLRSLTLFILSFASFTVKGLGAYAVARAVYPFPLTGFFLAFFGGELSSVLPVHGFMGFGTYEAGFVLGMKLAGASYEEALKAGFLVHLYLLLSSAAWGLPAIAVLHTSARKSL